MTPQEKRKKTIIERYGSWSNAMKSRDVRDLILGGYNGGKHKTSKGFSKWEDGKLSDYAKKRERDSKGRFIPETPASTEVRDEDEGGQANR